MRYTFFIIVLFFPFCFYGQQFYSIAERVPSSSQLISVGEYTVLIQPLDLTNKEQKWSCLDKVLSEVSSKKIITPDADKLLSQVYIPSANSIIRLDQYVVNGHIILSAFAFDALGNVLKQQLLEPVISVGNPLHPIPFNISQTQNKELLSISQSVKVNPDSVQLRNILLDKDLNILSNNVFNIPFNADLFDYYMPVLNEQGTTFFITAEKVDSYRLSSDVVCYYQDKGNDRLKKLQFEINRKKLKKINFYTNGSSFSFNALYTSSKENDDIAGVVQGSFDLSTNKYLPLLETAYSEEIKDQLKKAFWADRRKGNFLNYLALLPAPDGNQQGFGYIQPKEEFARIDNSKSYDNPKNDIANLQQKAAYVLSLVGTTPKGYSKPLNAAEAMDFAARQAANLNANSDRDTGPNFKEESKRETTIGQYQKNLILFSSEAGKEAKVAKLHKIKSNPGQEYQFFTYYPAADGYAALYYATPGFGLPYISRVKMDHKGSVTEKKVFDDSSKIILSDFPFLLNENSFTGFCADKDTGLIGLVKFDLK